MSHKEIDKDSLARLVTQAVLGDDFRRATFAGAPRGGVGWPWLRVVVRPLLLRGVPHLQFSYFDRKKDVTKNFLLAEAAAPLAEVIAAGHAGIHLSAGG